MINENVIPTLNVTEVQDIYQRILNLNEDNVLRWDRGYFNEQSVYFTTYKDMVIVIEQLYHPIVVIYEDTILRGGGEPHKIASLGEGEFNQALNLSLKVKDKIERREEEEEEQKRKEIRNKLISRGLLSS